MTRFDLCSPRKRRNSDKTYWHKVGAMFADDKGGFSLVFDSLPIADDEGRVAVKAFPAKEREQQRGGYDQSPAGSSSGADDGDEIPF